MDVHSANFSSARHNHNNNHNNNKINSCFDFLFVNFFSHDTLCNSLTISEKCVGLAGNKFLRNVEGVLPALIPLFFFLPHHFPISPPPREKNREGLGREARVDFETFLSPLKRGKQLQAVYSAISITWVLLSTQSIAQGPVRGALFFSNQQPHPGTSLHLTLYHFTPYVPP